MPESNLEQKLEKIVEQKLERIFDKLLEGDSAEESGNLLTGQAVGAKRPPTTLEFEFTANGQGHYCPVNDSRAGGN